MADEKIKRTLNLGITTNTPSSDVFAYLSRFLPKRTDVLWVAQELERIHRLPDLAQQEKAHRELYTKIERHILAGKAYSITADQLRERIRKQFPHEIETGFLKPVFTQPFTPTTQKASEPTNTTSKPKADLPKKEPAPKKPEPAPSPLTFTQLKERLESEKNTPVAARLKTASGKVISVSLKGASVPTGDHEKQYVIAIKDLRVAQRYLQDRLQTLTEALIQAQSGDVSALVSLEAQNDGLQACVKLIKTMEYDRQDKVQKIEELKQTITSKEEELKSQAAKVSKTLNNLKQVSGQLQQTATELAETKRISVQRELKWQSRILELEQAKQAAVERELNLQKNVAALEQAKQDAVERELQLQEHVAELEQAKEVALKQQQQVARMKQEIEDFYRKLSQDA